MSSFFGSFFIARDLMAEVDEPVQRGEPVGGSRVRLLAVDAPAPGHAALRRILSQQSVSVEYGGKKDARVLTGKSGPCHQSEPNVAAPTMSLKSPTAEPQRQTPIQALGSK